MTPEEITAMAREAGFGRNGFSECLVRSSRGVWIDVQDEVNRLVALVAEKAAAQEREEIALEFDKRAVLRDGGPAVGWYEPDEPAEIVRARGQKGGV
jgi:hypothetical protein